jgi:hypothetical protein
MKMTNPWIALGVVVCGLLAGPAPLHAQPADAPSAAGGENMPWNRGVPAEHRAAARDVFLEGNRLFKIPLFAQAVEKYDDALARWRHPAFYFNLALAQLNLGQDLEARDSLEHALQYGAEPLGVDRFKEAQNQLRELQSRLGRIRVSCPTPGIEVTLDGLPLFTGPGRHDVWVKPQAHEVTAKGAEYATQSRHVAVAPGGLTTLDLALRKVLEDRPWALWKPWAVVGSGVAIAAAGGVLHAVSAHNFDAYDAGFVKLSCATSGCTPQQIDAMNSRLGPRLNRAKLEQDLAVGGYVAGGAVIAAGVVLLYMNRPHLMEQETAEPPATGVTLAPVISPGTLGVLVTVSR